MIFTSKAPRLLNSSIHLWRLLPWLALDISKTCATVKSNIDCNMLRIKYQHIRATFFLSLKMDDVITILKLTVHAEAEEQKVSNITFAEVKRKWVVSVYLKVFISSFCLTF